MCLLEVLLERGEEGGRPSPRRRRATPDDFSHDGRPWYTEVVQEGWNRGGKRGDVCDSDSGTVPREAFINFLISTL